MRGKVEQGHTGQIIDFDHAPRECKVCLGNILLGHLAVT